MNRKFMKNTNIYIVTILFFVFGCSIAKNYSDSQVRGNGKSISEIRDLKEFTEIEEWNNENAPAKLSKLSKFLQKEEQIFQRTLDMGVEFDHNTGLFWQKDDGGKMVWGGALSYCRNLNFAGSSDWRLPDTKTLQRMFARVDGSPASKFFLKGKSSNINSCYWTSTSISKGSSHAYQLNYHMGVMDSGYKSDYCFVRCVRGGN